MHKQGKQGRFIGQYGAEQVRNYGSVVTRSTDEKAYAEQMARRAMGMGGGAPKEPGDKITLLPRGRAAMIILDENITYNFPLREAAGELISEKIERTCRQDLGRECHVAYVGKKVPRGEHKTHWVAYKKDFDVKMGTTYRASPDPDTYYTAVKNCHDKYKNQKPSAFGSCLIAEPAPIGLKYVFGEFLDKDGRKVGNISEDAPRLLYPPTGSDDRYIRDFAQANDALIASCDSDEWLESSQSNSDRILLSCGKMREEAKNGDTAQAADDFAKAVTDKLKWMWKGEG